MWVILASSSDYSAIWAFEGLQNRGLAPLELVTSEELAVARYWEHRVGVDGVHFKIALQDGRVLCSSRIRGALNRMMTPATALINHAVASDREYALAEMQAFYLSWLNAVPGVVVNRPTPQGLSGTWRHSSEWALKASRCGLQVPRYSQTGHDSLERGYEPLAPEGALLTSVVVLDDDVFGPSVPEEVVSACRELARTEKTRLLGVSLYRDQDGPWLFASATPSPWLPAGGDALLDRLAALLQTGEAR